MKILIGILVVVIGASVVLIKFIGESELEKIKDLKSHPIKYVYFQRPVGVSISLSSSKIECMQKIKQYYDQIRNGKEIYLPPCFEHGIPVNDSIFVLETETDDQFVLISSFYRDHNQKEKYFIGYVLKETLHDTPYVKSPEP